MGWFQADYNERYLSEYNGELSAVDTGDGIAGSGYSCCGGLIGGIVLVVTFNAWKRRQSRKEA